MFKIGDFSRLSQVPVTALRYYDEVGLLKPTHIDRWTGYRYYSMDQLPRLNRILALKDLGLTLEQIASLLDNGIPAAEIRGMLRLRQAEMQERMQDEQARLLRVQARLRQIEMEGQMSNYDVVLKKVESQPRVISLRRAVAKPTDVGQFYYELEVYLGERGETMDGPPFTIWHSTGARQETHEPEAVMPVRASFKGDDKFAVHEVPGVECVASAIFKGSYEGISEAYAAVGEWIEANGYRVAGPCREVYLRFDATGAKIDYPPEYFTADPSEMITEIQFPVDKS
jgi:DNA-binding transcriptional MerR regulator